MGNGGYRTSLCQHCTLFIKDYSPVTRYSRTARASTIGYGSRAGQSWCDRCAAESKWCTTGARIGGLLVDPLGQPSERAGDLLRGPPGLAVPAQEILADRFVRQDLLARSAPVSRGGIPASPKRRVCSSRVPACCGCARAYRYTVAMRMFSGRLRRQRRLRTSSTASRLRPESNTSSTSSSWSSADRRETR